MAKKKVDKDKHELEIAQKNEIKDLEQFYTNGTVDNLLEHIEEQKEKIVADMIEYSNQKIIPYKFDKDGNPIAYKTQYNPLVVNNMFFKPIVPIGSIEPEYSPEKLALVFDYYCFLVAEVNDKIGNYPSSLTSFCKLAGISFAYLRKLRNSSDMNMRIIVEKIYDQIGDTNITMSQLGIVSERSTIFKMKSQNEMIEKEQPKININITEKPDLELINERINKYKKFADKKGIKVINDGR